MRRYPILWDAGTLTHQFKVSVEVGKVTLAMRGPLSRGFPAVSKYSQRELLLISSATPSTLLLTTVWVTLRAGSPHCCCARPRRFETKRVL